MKYEVMSVAAALAVAGATNLSDASPESRKLMWDAFKEHHGRNYATEEEEFGRYEVFINSLKLIDQRNAEERAAGGSAVHDITQFSDWTQEEFERLLNYEPGSDSLRGSATDVEVPPYDGVESLVDWTGKYTTPVKDQGYCGSCWAFAATEQIESDAMRTLQKSYTLSPQQIVSCDKKDGGCNGGRQETAYNYVKNCGGQEMEKDYPYTSGKKGANGSCKENSNKFVLGVSGYSTVRGESSMSNYVKNTGPLSIVLDASDWNSYRGGIKSSCGTRINHAVQAVGVDTSSGGYWKVRNSWGKSWGESGYIRLAYGKNTCGLASQGATYVKPKEV
jgi:C1A family cysteine protease